MMFINQGLGNFPLLNQGTTQVRKYSWRWGDAMDAAKDLLKRAVELDTAQKYSEAMICYEQGVQNLLRQMKGSTAYAYR